MLATILTAFGLDPNNCNIIPFGSGLINHTWRVECDAKAFILQRINHHVFTQPAAIAGNLETIGSYLQQQHPGYLFTRPYRVNGSNDTLFIHETEGYFRLFPFVAGSHTIDVVQTVQQAYEAAAQFGRFSKLLSSLPLQQLEITLPDFHNLTLRYQQFTTAIANATASRRQQAQPLIAILMQQQHLAATYTAITSNASFPLRVIHHDTKISNVLFNSLHQGLCVIDLDTVMPGYFISDLGDMMRTYLSPVSEEERDTSLITVREDYFSAIIAGYLDEMQAVLTEAEKAHFLYAGQFMVYMQAIRFLTDYLNNDVYYKQQYEGHNLERAYNQSVLLQQLQEKEPVLKALLEKEMKA